MQEPLGDADGADVETVVPANAVGPARDELRRAAADVHDHGSVLERPLRRDAAKHQHRLVVPGEQARLEAVAPLDLAEERLAVLRVANRARRDCERPLRAERLRGAAKVGEDIPHTRNRAGEEAPALVDALAEPRDARLPRDVRDSPIVDVRDEEPRGIGAEIDRRNTAHGARLYPSAYG